MAKHNPGSTPYALLWAYPATSAGSDSYADPVPCPRTYSDTESSTFPGDRVHGIHQDRGHYHPGPEHPAGKHEGSRVARPR